MDGSKFIRTRVDVVQGKMDEFRLYFNNFICCVFGVQPFQLEKQCLRLVIITVAQAFKVYYYQYGYMQTTRLLCTEKGKYFSKISH